MCLKSVCQAPSIRQGVAHNILLLLLFFGILINVYQSAAQTTGWVSGYVITEASDTLREYYEVSGTWTGNGSQLSGQFAYSYLKLRTGLRWQLSKPSTVSPFAMVGISNGFVVSHQQTIRQSELNRTYEQALFGAIGLRKDRLLGEVRYERVNGIGTGTALITRTQTLLALLGYAF